MALTTRRRLRPSSRSGRRRCTTTGACSKPSRPFSRRLSMSSVSNLNADMAAVYKRHDVLLHTPEWAEPFPLTALEAMACGLPVIGSTAGGAEELLRHGENSLTYPPGDAAQLAARMQALQLLPA